MFDLTGKNAIITGSSKGIGKSIAAAMAQQGANVCLLYTSPSPRDRQKSRMPSSA